jgi:glucokinase
VRRIVGIDLGGTKIATALATEDGNILTMAQRPTNAGDGLDVVLDRLEQAARGVVEQAGIPFSAVFGVGIGAPSPVESITGIVAEPPNLPGWHNVPLKSLMEQRLGLPVYVGNDANVTAQAECFFGAGRGTRNMVYITASTGIGGGMVLNGRPYIGSDGAAGEVGHTIIQEGGPRCMCGNIGCWEALASGTALARDARVLLAEGRSPLLARLVRETGEDVSATTVYRAACQGDQPCQELIANIAHYLGVGLVNLVNIFNPDMIVIGGGMANMGEMLLGPAREVVNTRARELPRSRVRIVPAALGEKGPVLGAIALVVDSTSIGEL